MSVYYVYIRQKQKDVKKQEQKEFKQEQKQTKTSHKCKKVESKKAGPKRWESPPSKVKSSQRLTNVTYLLLCFFKGGIYVIKSNTEPRVFHTLFL